MTIQYVVFFFWVLEGGLDVCRGENMVFVDEIKSPPCVTSILEDVLLFINLVSIFKIIKVSKNDVMCAHKLPASASTI